MKTANTSRPRSVLETQLSRDVLSFFGSGRSPYGEAQCAQSGCDCRLFKHHAYKLHASAAFITLEQQISPVQYAFAVVLENVDGENSELQRIEITLSKSGSYLE